MDRNLIARPAFPHDGPDADVEHAVFEVEPWEEGAGLRGVWGGFLRILWGANNEYGGRLQASRRDVSPSPLTVVPVEGETFTPGAEYHLSGIAFVSSGNSPRTEFMFVPHSGVAFFSHSPAPSGPYVISLDTADHDGWTEFSGTLTVSDQEWVDTQATPIPIGESEPLYLAVVGGGTWVQIDRVRVSKSSEADYDGYFDGSMDPEGDWTFDWEGEPWESVSTATLPEPDPDPEDPDPEDPDPEDPDPEDPDPEDPDPEDPDPEDPDPEDPDPEDPDPEDPDPEDPEDPWDEWDELSTRLAPRVAAFIGHPGNAELTATAAAQLPVVAEYVRGFTRGRGFTGEAPAGPLRAVIVSGAARLATNPEQVSVFTTGDYSERPAQLAGWTLAELGVLRRYRRVSA